MVNDNLSTLPHHFYFTTTNGKKSHMAIVGMFKRTFSTLIEHFIFLYPSYRHTLFADDMSDTSQDKASSGGQSKRRRETETGASSSSTAETKSTRSKRRKRWTAHSVSWGDVSEPGVVWSKSSKIVIQHVDHWLFYIPHDEWVSFGNHSWH